MIGIDLEKRSKLAMALQNLVPSFLFACRLHARPDDSECIARPTSMATLCVRHNEKQRYLVALVLLEK